MTQCPIPPLPQVMSRVYKATGINLKSMPLGESDRLLTILTREFGLIRAVAPGSRKHNSKLGGRSASFVVNELLIAKGRSLDKITQAETLESYPGLSQDLAKLSASQYLAEIILCCALSEQPQEELFSLLNTHLGRLEKLPSTTSKNSYTVLAHLAHAVFHILALSGIAPQLQACCLTQQPLIPDFTAPEWRVGFSTTAGGTVSLSALARLQAEGRLSVRGRLQVSRSLYTAQEGPVSVGERNAIPSQGGITTQTAESQGEIVPPLQTAGSEQEMLTLNNQLSAIELALLQHLPKPQLPFVQENSFHLYFSDPSWRSVERILRQYTEYHFGRQIRSGALMDTYFA